MATLQLDSSKPMPEQITYANILFAGAWIGIFMMMLTYILYVSGIMTPHVDVTVVAQNWDKGVHEYLETTHSPHGWAWVGMLSKGDFLNFAGMSLLALLSIVCYFVLTVGYVKRQDWIYLTIAVLEIIVLSLAASGIFGAGGH